MKMRTDMSQKRYHRGNKRDCKATRDVGSISVADQRHDPQEERTEQ